MKSRKTLKIIELTGHLDFKAIGFYPLVGKGLGHRLTP
jgi:hypothetical protein